MAYAVQERLYVEAQAAHYKAWLEARADVIDGACVRPHNPDGTPAWTATHPIQQVVFAWGMLR